MTLEELRNKTVTITLNKTIRVVEDLGDDILKEIFKSTCPMSSLLAYYDSIDALHEILDYNDYKITIE